MAGRRQSRSIDGGGEAAVVNDANMTGPLGRSWAIAPTNKERVAGEGGDG